MKKYLATLLLVTPIYAISATTPTAPIVDVYPDRNSLPNISMYPLAKLDPPNTVYPPIINDDPKYKEPHVYYETVECPVQNLLGECGTRKKERLEKAKLFSKVLVKPMVKAQRAAQQKEVAKKWQTAISQCVTPKQSTFIHTHGLNLKLDINNPTVVSEAKKIEDQYAKIYKQIAPCIHNHLETKLATK